MSKIEWTEHTWNPFTGCTKISPACKNCYAERMAKRLVAMGLSEYKDGFKPTVHYHKILECQRWKKPRMVFVNSMSDTFHESHPTEAIRLLFDAMAGAPQHTFQILTKRADRLAELASCLNITANIWIGVTVENQDTANYRIPLLLTVPAKVRFLSVEPMLGPVSLRWLAAWQRPNGSNTALKSDSSINPEHETNDLDGAREIQWVISGGESGPGARPLHPDWVRTLRDQCIEADVPFFFKQWGEWCEYPGCLQRNDNRVVCLANDGRLRINDPSLRVVEMFRCGKKAAGKALDGVEWNQMPKNEVSNNGS